MIVRDVVAGDSGAVASIYAFHVLNGTASYELRPPGEADTLAKIHRITGRDWPFLVATEDGEVVAYAYAEQFRDRPAYRYTCENSIYVRADCRGRGIGKHLLEALCERAQAAGFLQMVAVIGGGEPASVALHRKCGFEIAGTLRSVGWKTGRWLDSVYMQRPLGAGDSERPAD